MFFVLILFGCNLSNPSGKQDVTTDDTSVIPNSVWISDAESWFNISQNLDSSYSLYCALSNSSDNEIKMLFGSNKSIYAVDILGNPTMVHSLYFENEKIVFSRHIDSSSHIEWLVAYANELPYAAAAKNGGEWKAVHPQDIPIDQNLIKLAERRAKQYERKEKRHRYSYRISKNSENITGKFERENSLSFAMNVRKGDNIHLSLGTSRPTIFFTVEPNNGSNMEHREWNGVAATTGDLNITIFSVETEPNQKFSLNIKNTSPQNLASLPRP